ncbi:MAG: hypothetical protein WBA74_27965 [Cyclobacteriaceae bacterium]
MKQTRYLCIQGKYAPKFHLKNECSQNFRSLIESVTLSSALVISSRYKSDIIYCAAEDRTVELIKMWSTYLGISFEGSLPEKFTKANGESDLLEFYFVKLAHLSMHRNWYREYCTLFGDLCNKEPNHKLLAPIIACDKYLKEISGGNGGLPEMPVSQIKYSIRGFNLLAEKTRKNLSSN